MSVYPEPTNASDDATHHVARPEVFSGWDQPLRRRCCGARGPVGPSGTQKVTIAVWFLDQSPPGNVSQSCAIPNDMEWHQCFTRLFHAPGQGRLRVEVYNNSGFNVDIDTLILGDLAQLHQDGGVGGAEWPPGGGPVPGIPPGVVPPAPIPGGMLPAGPGVPEDLDR